MTSSRLGAALTWIALALIPVNCVVFCMVLIESFNGTAAKELWWIRFSGIALAQLVLGILAVVVSAWALRKGEKAGLGIAGGLVALILAPFSWVVGIVLLMFGTAGGAWGRPLRVRGRQLHPSLREGADWTCGARPNAAELDQATRRALEGLWLHDAQKEHASVPAFARVSWLLAAAGAPADLLAWAHRAAIEEIEHTQACFALAAGYGGRSHTVEPMPDLILGGFDGKVDPRVTLAIESLGDGCQLEDFNADVAHRCAEVCVEPVTRSVLERIAREERSHADFSWAVLDWLLAGHRQVVEKSIRTTLEGLKNYPRPTAVAADKLKLVAGANADTLREHGRLPDFEWGQAWDARLLETGRRVAVRLDMPTRVSSNQDRASYQAVPPPS